MKITIDSTVLIDFLSKVMGENTEIALHQLDEPDSPSLIDIRNGHITGRTVGMSLTNFAQQMIEEFKLNNNVCYKTNYLSLTEGRKKLRSSSLLLCDDTNKPKAMLCLNHDDIIIHNMIHQLGRMITIDDNQNIKENFSGNVKEINENIINDILAKYPISPERLSIEDKLKLVSELSEKGVFLIKGSVEIVSSTLNISEPTLYRYLKQIHS